MRCVLVVALAFALGAPVSSAFAAGARGAAATASISGTAKGGGARAANATVRLRNVANGDVVATAPADAAGRFSFVNLNPGEYTVEVVNAAGNVIATSAAVTLAEGAAVTGVSLSAAGVIAGTVASVGSFFGSSAGVISLAAAGAAVGGVTAATRTQASSSK